MSSLVHHNAPLIRATAKAFLTIQERSWPHLVASRRLTSAAFERQEPTAAVAEFLDVLEEVCEAYPRVRFFWKDQDLAFLGMSAALAREAGLESVEACVGLTDTSEPLPWRRQAAKYQRDDRRVIASGHAEFNLLERQDHGDDATRWLRTSKAPIQLGERIVGLLGAFDIISNEEARVLSVRQG